MKNDSFPTYTESFCGKERRSKLIRNTSIRKKMNNRESHFHIMIQEPSFKIIKNKSRRLTRF